MSAPVSGGTSDPTQAYAAVGANGQGGQGAPSVPSASAQGGMTWQLPLHDQGDPRQGDLAQGDPAQASQAFPTQAIPAQNAAPEPDPFGHLYRPAAGEPPRPNATQVMAPVPADFGRAEYGHDQPAYDQPIDYQAAGGGAYAEPYENGYADDYPQEPGTGPSPNRGAKIGIGVAAGAVLVIVIALITLGGHSTPSAGPAVTPGSVTTPTGPQSSQSAVANVPSTSAPSSSSSSSAPHIPGALQLGDTGAEVKWLQTRLHQLGLYNGPINSTFDAATQAAVAAFQNRTHPSDPSGVVGRSTKTALIAAGSRPTLTPQLSGLPVFGGDKHHKGGGDNPADVKRLQQALSSALKTTVKATGQYDMDTFGAVVQYQSANNLPADGVVNGPVWAALQSGKISG